MDPRDVAERCKEELIDKMFWLTAGYPMRESGVVFERIAELYQALASSQLLAAGDVARYQRYLQHAGYSRRYYLDRSQAEGNVDDRFLAASWNPGFLCAMAAGNIDLAIEIVDLTPGRHNPSWEYLEDFLFTSILAAWVRATAITSPQPIGTRPMIDALASKADIPRLTSRLEALTPRAPRLDLCRALLAGDGAAFDTALAERTQELDALSSAKSRRALDDDFAFWPSKSIQLEIVTVVRIAQRANLATRPGYDRCPPIALPAVCAKARDPFKELPALTQAARQ